MYFVFGPTLPLFPDKFDADDELKLIRILKYLHGTTGLGITLKSDLTKPLNIDVYADASFAIHTADRRSHSGLCIQIGSSTILCKTGKQPPPQLKRNLLRVLT
jgi:hypothetical protein